MQGREPQQRRRGGCGADSNPSHASTLRAELAAATGYGAAASNSGAPVDRIGVVVPANNEESALPVCLEGLRVAACRVTTPVTVVVVLDSCTDFSADVVREAIKTPGITVRAVTVDAHNVGFARRAGMSELLDLIPQSGTWLATTDADSVVPENWFAAQLDHAAAGARVVAGTVTVEDWQEHSHAVRDRATSDYLASPHRHVHGANLSFTATAYLAAGGFSPLAFDEDVDLVGAFRANDEPIAWAMDLAVTTSARRQARAPRGFAGYLSSLADPLEDVQGGR
jgi:hypothetical protein